MKEKELRENATCKKCGRKIGETGIPLFWRVKIERFGIDRNAVLRQDGLAQMMGGNSAIAAIVGPNEDLAKPMMEPVKVTLCEPCAVESIIAQLALG